MKNESYKSIEVHTKSKLKVKNSTFIALIYPVTSDDEIDKILKTYKKKYYDASHICYAYKLRSGKTKYSDAGEPSGSAGIRILNAINHFDLNECLLIIVRYFGGTKLGIGPLGKAYYDAAVKVISQSKIRTKQPHHLVEIKIVIADYDVLKGILKSNRIEIKEEKFSEQAVLRCLINSQILDTVKAHLYSKLNQKVEILVKNEVIHQ